MARGVLRTYASALELLQHPRASAVREAVRRFDLMSECRAAAWATAVLSVSLSCLGMALSTPFLNGLAGALVVAAIGYRVRERRLRAAHVVLCTIDGVEEWARVEQ